VSFVEGYFVWWFSGFRGSVSEPFAKIVYLVAISLATAGWVAKLNLVFRPAWLAERCEQKAHER
jgi:hypothetical protein